MIKYSALKTYFTDGMVEAVEEGFKQKILVHLGDDYNFEISVDVVSRNKKEIHLILDAFKQRFITKVVNEDYYVGLNDAFELLEKQLLKHKDKWKNKK